MLKQRLLNEYRVTVELESLSYSRALGGGEDTGLQWLQNRRDYRLVQDRNDNFVILSDGEWPLNYALKNAPGLELFDVEPFERAPHSLHSTPDSNPNVSANRYDFHFTQAPKNRTIAFLQAHQRLQQG